MPSLAEPFYNAHLVFVWSLIKIVIPDNNLDTGIVSNSDISLYDICSTIKTSIDHLSTCRSLQSEAAHEKNEQDSRNRV